MHLLPDRKNGREWPADINLCFGVIHASLQPCWTLNIIERFIGCAFPTSSWDTRSLQLFVNSNWDPGCIIKTSMHAEETKRNPDKYSGLHSYQEGFIFSCQTNTDKVFKKKSHTKNNFALFYITLFFILLGMHYIQWYST